MPRSSVRVTANPSIVTYDLAESRNPYMRRPTRSCCDPGFPPPPFTYSPWPETQTNELAGSDPGAAVESVSDLVRRHDLVSDHSEPPHGEHRPERDAAERHAQRPVTAS